MYYIKVTSLFYKNSVCHPDKNTIDEGMKNQYINNNRNTVQVYRNVVN